MKEGGGMKTGNQHKLLAGRDWDTCTVHREGTVERGGHVACRDDVQCKKAVLTGIVSRGALRLIEVLPDLVTGVSWYMSYQTPSGKYAVTEVAPAGTVGHREC